MSPCDLVHEMIFRFQLMNLPNNFVKELSLFCEPHLVGDGEIWSEIDTGVFFQLRKENKFFAAEVG